MNVAEEYARDAIRLQFLREREAYRGMVGTLYPSISYQRLCELRASFVVAGGSSADLPHTPCPLSDGSSPYFV